MIELPFTLLIGIAKAPLTPFIVSPDAVGGRDIDVAINSFSDAERARKSCLLEIDAFVAATPKDPNQSLPCAELGSAHVPSGLRP